MPICCLVSGIVAYLSYCYDWMEFALTAFRINRTGAIDSSWIQKITSFHYQQLDSYVFPLFFISRQKRYNKMCDSKDVLIWTTDFCCERGFHRPHWKKKFQYYRGMQKGLILVRTKGNLLTKGITVHQQNSTYITKTPVIAPQLRQFCIISHLPVRKEI